MHFALVGKSPSKQISLLSQECLTSISENRGPGESNSSIYRVSNKLLSPTHPYPHHQIHIFSPIDKYFWLIRQQLVMSFSHVSYLEKTFFFLIVWICYDSHKNSHTHTNTHTPLLA